MSDLRAAMIEAAAELHAHEFGQTTDRERSYERWLARAAKVLGVLHLDEDEDTAGYSLDSAYDAWDNGITPEQYAQGTRSPVWIDTMARQRTIAA